MSINNHDSGINMQQSIANFAQNYNNTLNKPIEPITKSNDITSVKENIVQKKDIVIDDKSMDEILNKLRPKKYDAPVKITEPSYLISEKQLRQLLGVAQGNPNIELLSSDTSNNTFKDFANDIKQQLSNINNNQNNVSNTNNAFDNLANATLGTVGRIGHTFTDLATNVIDIITLGYANK